MPTTVTTDRPATTMLRHQERQVLSAVGCGLRDDEVAAALAVPEDVVAERLARILVKLGLRDRAAAIVHAFDCGLVVPGRGARARSVRPVPRAVAVRATGPKVRISLLGPLRARRDGHPLDLGHLRQQAVLAVLALSAGRSLSQQELLADVWGMEPPAANVVPVYIYRLRKALHVGDGPDPVIERGLRGYHLVSGAVDVDVARVEELITDIRKVDRGENRSRRSASVPRRWSCSAGSPWPVYRDLSPNWSGCGSPSAGSPSCSGSWRGSYALARMRRR